MADINAYLKKRRRRRGLYVEISLVVFVVFAVLALSWWLLFRAQILTVRSMEVRKSDSFSEDEVLGFLRNKLMSSWWKRQLGFNNFMVWPDEIKGTDVTDFPKAKSIVIDKSYFSHKLVIDVVERERSGVWCVVKVQKCYWFDRDGYMFNIAPEVQGNLLTVVRDSSQADLGLGSMVLPGKYISNFFSIVEVLNKSAAGVGRIELADIGLEEVKVVTDGGPELYFSLRFPADNTGAVIDTLRNTGEYQKLKYIDFRIPNRAYYK